MQLLSKNKLSLSLALAVCLCAPISGYAGNDGGSYVGGGDDYIGKYEPGTGAEAKGWNVTIDSDVKGSVYGAYSLHGAANNNKVTITAGTVEQDVYGGKGTAAGVNTVTIEGGTINGYVYGGYSGSSTAIDNKVIIEGGTINGYVYGGYSDSSTAIDNKVIIEGGTIKGNIYGGYSDSSTASDNKVIINGGTIKGNIYGGYSYADNVDGNTITINGGDIQSTQIVAGWSNQASASNNTVKITGSPIFASNTAIVGGMGMTTTSNNTFIIETSGITVGTIAKFDRYDLAIGNTNQVTLTADYFETNDNSKVSAPFVLPSANLKAGDKVTVLHSNGLSLGNGTEIQDGIAKQGVLYEYKYTLNLVGNEIIADIISKEANRQSMSVADGQLAAMGMLRSGADMVAGSAMNNAAKSEMEYDVFGALNYTNISMDSVSSVDVQGSSMLVGMGRNVKHSNSNTTLGAFLEAGWGTYESSTGLAHANGHTNYYGIGVLARNNNDNGVYTEGSIRVGKVGNTYSGRTVADGSYDVSSTYYGAHIGIGKINQINEKTSTDIYAKYFYAHEGGTSANIAGDNFDFDSIDSHRVRIGGRLNSMNKNINRYVGLAYEYEFGGKANATAYGKDIASPTAKGSSGILELGLVYKPAPDSKFSMDMGVNGYAGKRKGVTGNVTLNWGF